ncbi:hypothetical protein AVEN_66138-1 [Araneus ventricosus]|uniref:Uncharacterized protein n=1 Tax=Araneus ventricosus TaxID=182803 RepID=A0A4Y2HIW0_ARAVE|nr:hypothetical protein AVEN_66138-1 [Araneus ventricosus]
MSVGLFVTFTSETLHHLTLRDWIRAYLPLQHFKSTNEDHMYQVSSKSPNMSIGLFVACILETFDPPYPEGLGYDLFKPTVLQVG